ncbi:MAG TPA: PP2C family protein-serine/threonine phosphatase [Thermoleophilaceae bacterium]|jgi:hypothetical protein
MARFEFGGRLSRHAAAVTAGAALLAFAPAAAPGAQLVPQVQQVQAPLPDTPVSGPVQTVIDQATGQTNEIGNQVNNAVTPDSGGDPGSGGGPSGDGGGGGNGGGGGGGGNTPNGNGGGGGGGSNGGTGDGGGSDSGGTTAATRRAERRADTRRERRREAAAERRADRRERAERRDRGTGDDGGNAREDGTPGPLRPIRDVVEVIPVPMWIALALLALLAGAFFIRSFFASRRARHLEEQRAELLDDVGLLQKALLPDVPRRIGSLEASVAYRPAEGPAAGGDFYDVFEMEADRVGIIVGDVCGHGRQALAVTALMRYTLRAYLNAGGEPRTALQIAARALENEQHAELTTVVLSVYDRKAGTLTYACAGHEPPILVGPGAHKPVTIGSSPPVGAGLPTGLRQTTVSLPPGALACFFTDGLVEARLHDDGLLGRDRLCSIVEDLGGEATADRLLAQIAETAERSPDDMAACIVRAGHDASSSGDVRIEELELDETPTGEERARGFLDACGVPPKQIETVLKTAAGASAEFGGALLRVRLAEGGSGGVKVVPLELRSLGASMNGDGPQAAIPAAPPISA